jgi:hypothetical protein
LLSQPEHHTPPPSPAPSDRPLPSNPQAAAEAVAAVGAKEGLDAYRPHVSIPKAPISIHRVHLHPVKTRQLKKKGGGNHGQVVMFQPFLMKQSHPSKIQVS